MPEYRVYIVGSDGHFLDAVELTCDDDEAAIKQAATLVDGHDIELRQLHRQINKIQPQAKIAVVSTRPRGKKAVWTGEQNERLKAFVAQGVSIVRAAAVFNRTITSVRVQARKVGSPFPPMRVFRKKFADAPSSVWRQD